MHHSTMHFMAAAGPVSSMLTRGWLQRQGRFDVYEGEAPVANGLPPDGAAVLSRQDPPTMCQGPETCTLNFCILWLPYSMCVSVHGLEAHVWLPVRMAQALQFTRTAEPQALPCFCTLLMLHSDHHAPFPCGV